MYRAFPSRMKYWHLEVFFFVLGRQKFGVNLYSVKLYNENDIPFRTMFCATVISANRPLLYEKSICQTTYYSAEKDKYAIRPKGFADPYLSLLKSSDAAAVKRLG
jgi:hypothetical protein